MNENSQAKQPAVRPGLLVILFIALGVALYINFFMKPEPIPVSPPTGTTGTSVASEINNISIEARPEIEDLQMSIGPISKRDLFLPPPSIMAARRRKDTASSNRTVWNEPQRTQPVQSLLPSVQKDENPEKPVLKGIVGTASAQVIIVRYKNKSYLLKLGEILPGTEYRVAEISPSRTILQSPKGRLTLDRKERGK